MAITLLSFANSSWALVQFEKSGCYQMTAQMAPSPKSKKTPNKLSPITLITQPNTRSQTRWEISAPELWFAPKPESWVRLKVWVDLSARDKSQTELRTSAKAFEIESESQKIRQALNIPFRGTAVAKESLCR